MERRKEYFQDILEETDEEEELREIDRENQIRKRGSHGLNNRRIRSSDPKNEDSQTPGRDEITKMIKFMNEERKQE